MIPLFKTHFSVGKSILKPQDCFEIAKNEKEVVFVEDSFSSFRQLNKLAAKFNKPFRFGIRISVKTDDALPSKLILFAKNSLGAKELKSLFTEAYTLHDGVLPLKKFSENILVAVPFYDSYIHNSATKFGVFDLGLKDEIHFVEDNGHPFDFFIREIIDSLGVKTQSAKSIFYRNKENFRHYQFYKSTCNRSQGKQPTFESPEINDCGSDEFCWESFLEKR